MPLIAVDADTKDRIDITRYQTPKVDLWQRRFACQVCGSAMIMKAGRYIRPHFAHKPNAVCLDYKSHPESLEHLEAKAILAQNLASWFSEYTSSVPELEVPIPEVKRIADVLFTFPNGWRVAHEVQLASITTSELQARTNDYLSAGVDVVWWLGKSANSPANRNWCLEYQNVILEIHVDKTTADQHILGKFNGAESYTDSE